MKKARKTTAVVLCLVMLLMSLGTVAFAEGTKCYVVLGDSIGYGSGIRNSVEACYGKIVADTNGYEYANHAIPGHTTTNLIARLGEEKVKADVARADIISISIGGNDFLMSNLYGLMFDAMVKGDYSKFDAIGNSFYKNFCTIMELIRGLNSDAAVLMQTLYNPQSGYLRAPYQQGADRINAAIERYAEAHPGDIIIVDVASALNSDMANFASDAIHPSAQGNEEIAKLVLSEINKLYPESKTEPVINTKGDDIRNATFAGTINAMGVFFHILSLILGPIYSFIARIPMPYM
ncbi:MAG: SGNH/GDSL hydrolase family protein [Clostridia bacterium]|nr:SGNH/GDSL hydrolase family protein [Clostridia bacterium]